MIAQEKNLAEQLRERSLPWPVIRDLIPLEKQGDAYEGPANGPKSKPAKPPTAEELIRAQLKQVEKCGHDELLDADLPPLRWIVDGLIPDEGLTFLGGRKKLGKSWFCLQLAQAVSFGCPFLAKETSQGKVIYLCLEDGKRRLKGRLVKQQASRGLPITYYTRFPPLDGDGTGLLLELLDDERPRLLILDTLAAAKTGKVDENAAGPLADISNMLRGVGQYFQCGITVTHHHGKAVIGDPGGDLRGTSALGGAADLTLGLYREEGRMLIRGEGRDIDDFCWGLAFDAKETWSWQATEADVREPAGRQNEREVLDALDNLGEATAQGIAEHLGRTCDSTRKIIRNLVRQKMVFTREERPESRGRPRIVYRLPDLDYEDGSF